MLCPRHFPLPDTQLVTPDPTFIRVARLLTGAGSPDARIKKNGDFRRDALHLIRPHHAANTYTHSNGVLPP